MIGAVRVGLQLLGRLLVCVAAQLLLEFGLGRVVLLDIESWRQIGLRAPRCASVRLCLRGAARVANFEWFDLPLRGAATVSIVILAQEFDIWPCTGVLNT